MQLDDLYGFVDTRGEVVIDPQYPEVADFHEGLAAVHDEGAPAISIYAARWSSRWTSQRRELLGGAGGGGDRDAGGVHRS